MDVGTGPGADVTGGGPVVAGGGADVAGGLGWKGAGAGAPVQPPRTAPATSAAMPNNAPARLGDPPTRAAAI